MLTDENSALRMEIMTLKDVNAALVERLDSVVLQLSELQRTGAALPALAKIQEACPAARIASGIGVGAEIVAKEYKDALRLNQELTKKGEDLCQQFGWALVVLNRLLSLHQLDVAKDGDHPEFCDCAWCRAWGDVREVTGRSLKRNHEVITVPPTTVTVPMVQGAVNGCIHIWDNGTVVKCSRCGIAKVN